MSVLIANSFLASVSTFNVFDISSISIENLYLLMTLVVIAQDSEYKVVFAAKSSNTQRP